jgi:hypothetical protein
VYETAADVAAMQDLMDRSIAAGSEHLLGIFTPEHRLSAQQLVTVATGMRTLALATVTAAGEPRVSGVDGYLLRGRWLFTTSGTALKARHLRTRPACSVAHLQGDDLGIFVHGTADVMAAPEVPGWVEEHLVGHYGQSPTEWGPEIVYVWVEPSWMVAYSHDPV